MPDSTIEMLSPEAPDVPLRLSALNGIGWPAGEAVSSAMPDSTIEGLLPEAPMSAFACLL